MHTVQVEGRLVLILTIRESIALDFVTYPEERVAIIQERLEKVVVEGGAVPIFPARARGKTLIMAGRQPLLQVDEKEAEARALTVEELAEHWVRSLKAALARPTLFLTPASLLVPAGEVRSARIEGTAQGDIVLQNCDQAVALCFLEGEELRIFGVSPGKITVRLVRESVYAQVNVRVMYYAASFAPVSSLLITGFEFPYPLLREAFMEKIKESAMLQPGARLKMLSAEKKEAPRPGESRSFQVEVEASGKGYISRRNTFVIKVINEPSPSPPLHYFVLSNEPEEIVEPGILTRQLLQRDRPLRFLVHHKNMSGEPLDFLLEASNRSNQEAWLHVIDAGAGPENNELYTGFKATERFALFFLRRVGRIFLIPPGEKKVIWTRRLNPFQTISYLSYLRLLQGGSLDVKLAFYDPKKKKQLLPLPLIPGPRWGTFADQLVEKEVKYVVGREWGFLKLGDEQIRDLNHGQILQGNYGLWYRIRVRLYNPKERQVDVAIKLEASAGDCAGVFLARGQWVKLPYLPTHQVRLIQKVSMSPRSGKIFSITTLPVPGAHYPARILVHAL